MRKKKEHKLKLTTWEAYNYILKGLVEEVINVCGVDPQIRLTVFQLWATYLRKTEAAFFNDKEVVLPKLPAWFKKQDVDLLTTMANNRKRKHSEIDPEPTTKLDFEISRFNKKLIKSEDRSVLGQSVILRRLTRRKLCSRNKKQFLGRNVILSIIFCALNHHNSPIQITDFIRFQREGRISYFDCRHLLPSHLLTNDEIDYINYCYTLYPLFTQHKEFAVSIQQLSLFCDIDLNHPNMYELLERYATEMVLPREIYKFIEKLYSLYPPSFDYHDFGIRTLPIPFYEARAMAYILFALKLLFGLNGITEIAMSESAKRINNFIKKEKVNCGKLFVWSEWVEYFTARKLFISKYHCPTFIMNEGEEFSSKTTKNYLDLHKIHHKSDFQSKIEKKNNDFLKNRVPLTIRHEMGLENVAKDMKESKNCSSPSVKIDFPISFTPNVTYLETLKSQKGVSIPKILKNDFTKRDIESLIDKKFLRKKFKGIQISTKEAPGNSNVRFIHKNKKELLPFSKLHISFLCVTMNIDTKTFLTNLTAEEEQKRVSDCRIQENVQQELDSLKEHTKNMLRESRKSFRSRNVSDEDLFDRIESSSESESETEGELTLLTPNFDYWTFLEVSHYITQDLYDCLSVEFPTSFKWLLDNCANLLEMKPIHLYLELLTIETQFLYVLKPMFEVKDRLEFRNIETLPRPVRGVVRYFTRRILNDR